MQLESFDLIKDYNNNVLRGILEDDKAEKEIYEKNRKEAKEKNKEYKVIMSPSRASFFINHTDNINVFYGECHRKAFFDEKKATITNPDNPIGLKRMKMGKIYEENEHIYEEKGGILLKKNFRMYKEITPDVLLSGEVDSIVKLGNGKKYIVEHKSYDGYWAEKHINGSRQKAGIPKYEHIAQNMFYLIMMEDVDTEIDTVIFSYSTRGTVHYTRHILTLEKVKDKDGKTIDAYPVINGIKYTFTSMRELLMRGIQLANYIINDELPPRDPEYQYSEDKIRFLLSEGEIAKTRYKEWQNNPTQSVIGNWQCGSKYCKYHNLCMGNKPLSVLPTDDEVKSKIHSSKVDNMDSLWV